MYLDLGGGIVAKLNKKKKKKKKNGIFFYCRALLGRYKGFNKGSLDRVRYAFAVILIKEKYYYFVSFTESFKKRPK